MGSNKQDSLVNILLCGGSGTRLWPLSRKLLPKQFVRLFEGASLFQKSIERNQAFCDSTWIVTNVEQYFLALDQLEGIAEPCNTHFLLETVARNTAPAIALNCMLMEKEQLVLVTPSDHLISNQTEYQNAVERAKSFAKQGYLVTFGIQPTSPETGYGYIQAKGHDVLRFVEKPNKELAKQYLDSGDYYWNAGIFCFQAGVFLEELKQYRNDIYQACQKVIEQGVDNQEGCVKIDVQLMQTLPDASIDYAVMESSKKIKVVPCDIGWSDLGSFDALYEESKQQDESQNATIQIKSSSPEPVYLDSTQNLVVTHEREVALIDVNDLLVVDTSDALLISKRGSSQAVKKVLDKIKQKQPHLAHTLPLVYRPWGHYKLLQEGPQYKVKKIYVKPGGKLSMQKHLHRNEHWVVVSGTATVSIEDQTFIVRPNESTYIQMGQRHRLENQGKIDLVMIEVQVGEYTGEDDIIREDDIYGR